MTSGVGEPFDVGGSGRAKRFYDRSTSVPCDSQMVIRMYVRYWLILLPLVCIDCSDFGPDNSGKVVVSTDKSLYGALEKITFTVQNLSEPTAYMWHCNYRLAYRIQREEDDAWKSADDTHMLCLAIYLSGAMPIPFGQPYIDTLSLYIPGDYRLVINVGWDPATTPDYQIYSNTFRVE